MHCRGAAGSAFGPPPLGRTLTGDRPNEAVHFDFLYMKKSKRTEYCYVLVNRNGFTGYIDLVSSSDNTAMTAATALISWIARFGTPTTWVSDRGPYFFNHTIAEIAYQRGVEHHFTTARCPWTNGQIKRGPDRTEENAAPTDRRLADTSTVRGQRHEGDPIHQLAGMPHHLRLSLVAGRRSRSIWHCPSACHNWLPW